MTAISSSLSKPDDGTGLINRSVLHQLSGIRKQFTRTEFNAAVAAERARIAANSVGVWKPGEELAIVDEVCVRIWTVATGGSDAANAAASHARTALIGTTQLPLGADSNSVLVTTGIPSSSTGANGDYALDAYNQTIFYKASGLWSVAGMIAGPQLAGAPARVSGPALIAWLGDSQFARSTEGTFGAGNYFYSSIGIPTWAVACSMGALCSPVVCALGSTTPLVNYNRAVSGEIAEETLNRVPELDLLPIKPRFCGILTGTNNLSLNLSQSVQSIVTAIVAVSEAVYRRGITPVLCVLLPRGNGASAGATGWGSSFTAAQVLAQRGKLMQINRQLRLYAAANPGVILVDWFTVNLNFASATSDPLAAYHPDYLHSIVPGTPRLGQKFWSSVAPFVAPAVDSFQGSGDAYGAGDPFGSMIDSSWTAGGGTAGTGVSGTVPNGWSVNSLTGASSTVVVSRQARADGASGNEITLAMTGNDTSQFRVYQGDSAPTSTNFGVAGDAVYAECDVEFNGPGANQFANPDVTFWITESGGANSFVYAAKNNGTTEGDMQGSFKFRLRTPIIILPANAIVSHAWTIDGIKNGGSAVVTRRNFTLRKYDKTAVGAVTW